MAMWAFVYTSIGFATLYSSVQVAVNGMFFLSPLHDYVIEAKWDML